MTACGIISILSAVPKPICRSRRLILAAIWVLLTIGSVFCASAAASGGGLSVRYKSIVYTILALIGAWWFYFRLGWDVLNVPFFGNIQIGLWYIPIFVFIIFASAFSANETDGLDGLLGGVSLFAFLALATVSSRSTGTISPRSAAS